MPGEDDLNGAKLRPKRSKHAAALVLSNTDVNEPNKETNSSDTENASPAIPIGPNPSNSVSLSNFNYR